MNTIQLVIAYIFGLGLVINAGLFVVQGWQIYKTKTSQGVSLITFVGFCVLQLTGVLHGFFQRDPYLMWGMATSFLTCIAVTVLAIMYKKPKS